MVKKNVELVATWPKVTEDHVVHVVHVVSVMLMRSWVIEELLQVVVDNTCSVS
eukprot:COSAG01_NODE_19478_length_1007_cov_11.851322_2_plen_53_part_00